MQPNNPQPQPPETEPQVKKEIIQNIPVKNQYAGSGTDGMMNPVTTALPPPIKTPGTDSELDHILKDVNEEVKNPQKKVVRFSNDGAPVPPAKERRLLPIVAAITAAIILTAAAVYAFKQSSLNSNGKGGKPGSTKKGSLPITQNDVTSLSNSFQSDINGLNDASDFDISSLSDTTLGL
jgi:hypothetical protein